MRHLSIALSIFCVLLCTHALALSSSVEVFYDAGFGNSLSLRGRGGTFSATFSMPLRWTPGNVWKGEIEGEPNERLSFQVYLNDSVPNRGTAARMIAGQKFQVYPHFFSERSSLSRVSSFYSPELTNSRDIVIYLPPSYSENQMKSYPVIYAQDGQNLFEAETSAFGEEWALDEISEALSNARQMEEVIIVGIFNRGAERQAEYSFERGDRYLDFLTQTLKPWMDARYRTKSDRINTAIMGSSLGGLLAFYGAWKKPEVFGKALSMSGSFFWDEERLKREMEGFGDFPTQSEMQQRFRTKLYFDCGSITDNRISNQNFERALRTSARYIPGIDFDFRVFANAQHNEKAWRERLHFPLRYLFAVE